MIEGFTSLVPIRTDEEFRELVELAKVDSHGVYCPTHVVVKGGERVGWFSVGSGIPIVFGWLSTKKVKPRESFMLINMVENQLQLSGAQYVAFPVPKDSPFHPVMPTIGYESAGVYEFFVKKF